jgi:hypothetical protein
MLLPPRWLRRRWHFITIYWSIQVVAAYFMAIVFSWVFLSDALSGVAFWLAPFGVTALILGLQAIFLVPIRRPVVSTRGWPIMMSVVIGGLLIALLVVALGLAVGHVLDVYDLLDVGSPGLVLLGVLAAAWAVSTPLLVAFCRRGRREQILQRIAAGIFIGTIVEAMAIIPLDVLVRRREDCICATGTFIGLAICGSVGLFVFGPAIFLPLVLRHRKRWYGRRCSVCGYDMTGLGAVDRCPECGGGWKEQERLSDQATRRPSD